ncbi:MAG: DedD protein [Gammaproteobacteria bacterium]|nr:MAG: DedD protein [Gammaproteobacteria bacterium]TND07393.1 MAG: DedD protein [Gammaproteobacteria bacterium]
MESGKLKQRLVGVAVLVSIAVIFLPLVLQSPDEINPGFENEVIPPKSSGLSVKVLPLNIPERVEPIKPDLAPAAAAETAASDAVPVPPVADVVAAEPDVVAHTAPKPPVAQAESVPKTSGPPPAAKPVGGAPSAWVVQLGSFSSRDNAFALRDKLRKRRYAAFVDDVAGGPGNKRIYRVRVGPELLRSRADTLRIQLEKEFRLKGMVVTHEVS